MKKMFSISIITFLLFASICNSAVFKVGSTESYKKPSEVISLVADGDTVLIDAGLYSGDVGTWTKNNLYLTGSGGLAHLAAAGKNAQGKAIWVIQGNNCVVENIEFSDCSVPDKNGAGIRGEGTNLTVRHCYFHDNEDGILVGANTNSNMIIEFCEFARNGYGDGYSHNLYIGHINSLTFRFCYSHHARIGHNFKSRAENNYIYYNRIMDEETGTSSYIIDLPNGGETYIIGNLLQKGIDAENSTMISYGGEGFSNTNNNFYFINNTFVDDKKTGNFIKTYTGADSVMLKNNIFVGSVTPISGATAIDSSNNICISDTSKAFFVNPSIYDYRLLSSSPAIDAGVNNLSANSVSLVPNYEYLHLTDSIPRPNDEKIDIGAYEFSKTNDIKDVSTINRYKLSISPNPTNSFVNIIGNNLGYSLLSLSIYDSKGSLINQIYNNYHCSGYFENQIDLSSINISTGLYFIKYEIRNVDNLAIDAKQSEGVMQFIYIGK